MPRAQRVLAIVGAATLAAATVTAVLVGAPAAGAATSSAEAYRAVPVSRVVDTVTGASSNRHGALPGHHAMRAHIAGHGHVPSTGMSAVAATLIVRSPKASGSLIAWRHGAARPHTVNVQFHRGGRAADLAIIPVSSDGSIDLYNDSSGSVQVIVDVSGYFHRSAETAGAFHMVSPRRVVNTRTGAGGHRGPLGAARSTSPRIGGHAGVPSSGVAAVAVTITVDATRRGSLRAIPYHGAWTNAATVQFDKGRRISEFAMVPTTSSGRITLINASPGSIQIAVDVVGYVRSGVSATAGAYQPLDAHRVLNTRSGSPLSAGHGRAVHVAGASGVPHAFVAAVAVRVSVSAPKRDGSLIVRPSRSRAGSSSVQFVAGHSAADVVISQLSGTNSVYVQNASRAAVDITVTVTGYVLGNLHPAPRTSTGRYVRNLNGSFDNTGPSSDGCQDAKHSSLVLLDIGAQLNDGTGVALTVVGTPVAYGALRKALNRYLIGFGKCLPARHHATVAVGTNNDGDFRELSATHRGRDWAVKVINALVPPNGVTIAGANDIEPGFASTEKQAQAWEDAYLEKATRDLVFNGSADGCPTRYGVTGKSCAYGWTQKQIYHLAHNGSRIRVLPQVYVPVQAVQWANIDRAGGGGLIFAGSLTERAADPSRSLYPGAGWAALRKATYTVSATIPLRAAVDLRVDR